MNKEYASENSEAEEERNADNMSESDGDPEDSSGESFDGEDVEDEESSSTSDSDDDEREPQFLIKHKQKIPSLGDDIKCSACGKMKPAFFAACGHWLCCYQCYLDNYSSAATGTRYTVSSVCDVCHKHTPDYYYRPNAIQEEEAYRAAENPRKRKRFTVVDTYETDKLPPFFELPPVVQCKYVDEANHRCKKAGYYLADHGCYTEFCRDHETELWNDCPVCNKPVTYYHKHQRVAVPKDVRV